MAVVIKRKEVVEDVLDENNNKIGEIRFNPSDSRIMNKLSKIIINIEEAVKEQKKIGKIEKIPGEKIMNVEDFEKASQTFEKINNYLNIETKIIQEIIDDLSSIFGKENVELFTGGTLDIETLEPLIDCIIPYIKDARQSKVNQYITNNSDVMD